MGWVLQREPPKHKCELPGVRSLLNDNRGPYLYEGTGKLADLWRCDVCEKLYRLGLACDICEYYGSRHHEGQHMIGWEWRPATFWQRFLYRNR